MLSGLVVGVGAWAELKRVVIGRAGRDSQGIMDR